MKTIIWILTLAGAVPVGLFALVLLCMHLAIPFVEQRTGGHDTIVSIARNDSQTIVVSTSIWNPLLIVAGVALLLTGVWRLYHR